MHVATSGKTSPSPRLSTTTTGLTITFQLLSLRSIIVISSFFTSLAIIMPPTILHDSSSTGSPPKLSLYRPTTSNSTYKKLENFLEFLFVLYCIWALFCLIYISIRFGVWMTHTTRKALYAAIATPMTFDLGSVKTHTNRGIANASIWRRKKQGNRWADRTEYKDILAVAPGSDGKMAWMEIGPRRILLRQRGCTI